jgi:hypothetical protein
LIIPRGGCYDAGRKTRSDWIGQVMRKARPGAGCYRHG